MGNSESATSDEEDMANDLAMEESNEVIKVFQPRKLRDELENGKNFVIGKETDGSSYVEPYISFDICFCKSNRLWVHIENIFQCLSTCFLVGFKFTCKHHMYTT